MVAARRCGGEGPSGTAHRAGRRLTRRPGGSGGVRRLSPAAGARAS